MDFNAPVPTWISSTPHTQACCYFDLWPPLSNHVISWG